MLYETELLLAHVFSYKINSNICVLKEIWLIQRVKEGIRDIDINFKAYKVDVYEQKYSCFKSFLSLINVNTIS